MANSNAPKALYDGSDPLFCPWTSRSKDRFYWRCRPWAKEFPGAHRAALPGHAEDGNDLQRAAMARELTRAVYKWMNATPDVAPNTWAWLAHRYRTDDVSPIHDVKANTRAGYIEFIAKIEAVIGKQHIGFLTYVEARKMIRAMEGSGRSASYVSRIFRHIRILAGYGVALRAAGASDVRDMLGELRVKQGQPRTSVATPEHVLAIVEAADAQGLFAFGTGIMVQWETALRGVDVFGHWLDIPGTGGIRRGDKLWQDGLTWDMVSDDCRSFAKVVSKTRTALPETLHFQVGDETAARLRKLRGKVAFGPAIVSERNGLPYLGTSRAAVWRKLRCEAGVPDTVKMMDTRAGAITQAASAGATLIELRDAAQHRNSDTTQRYLRGRNESIARVHHLRESGRQA